MSDYFFKNFYDKVKDPSWPEIRTYGDFLRLSPDIVDECRAIHGLDARLKELSDRSYWIKQSFAMQVFVFENVAYLPIQKCASTYYSEIFRDRLRWRSQNLAEIDTSKVKVFSLIMDPMVRRLKGLVETLSLTYDHDHDAVLKSIQQQAFLDFLSQIMITDTHTTPYSLLFEPWFDHVHWIPLDVLPHRRVKEEIENFLLSCGIDIQLPDMPHRHKSDEKKRKIFDTLEAHFLAHAPSSELGLLFAKDMELYYKTVNAYANL